MRKLVYLLALLLVTGAVCAEPATMTRMVVKNTTPGLAEGAAVLPRTIYRQGTNYARVEEMPSPEDGKQMVIIRANSDMWQLDLSKSAGLHKGGFPAESSVPIFVHFPALEFGREVEFMRENDVEGETVEGPDGRPAVRYGARSESMGIGLYVEPDGDKPRSVLFVELETGEILHQVEYLEYSRGLPVQAELFAPPAGTSIQEVE